GVGPQPDRADRRSACDDRERELVAADPPLRLGREPGPCVGLRVRRGERREAGDVGVVADGDERLGVLHRPRPQRDDAVRERWIRMVEGDGRRHGDRSYRGPDTLEVMPDFAVSASYSPTGDQPRAIGELTESIM